MFLQFSNSRRASPQSLLGAANSTATGNLPVYLSIERTLEILSLFTVIPLGQPRVHGTLFILMRNSYDFLSGISHTDAWTLNALQAIIFGLNIATGLYEQSHQIRERWIVLVDDSNPRLTGIARATKYWRDLRKYSGWHQYSGRLRTSRQADNEMTTVGFSLGYQIVMTRFR